MLMMTECTESVNKLCTSDVHNLFNTRNDFISCLFLFFYLFVLFFCKIMQVQILGPNYFYISCSP